MKISQLILIGLTGFMSLGSCSSSKKSHKGKVKIFTNDPNKTDASFAPLRAKYAKMMNVTIDSITNVKLYSFVDEWLYTPYKWGGSDKRGIDCSAFIQKLLIQVYGVNIPRTAVDQFFTKNVEKFRRSRYLSEGDLVFFHTVDERTISHVGVYLCNRMFVNACSKGVIIGNLDDNYWQKKYVSAGRIKIE
jgi:lipoprotein Spr